MANSNLLFGGNFLEFFRNVFEPQLFESVDTVSRYREPTLLVIEGLPHTRYCLNAFNIVSFNQDNSHVHCELSVIALMFQARKQIHKVRQLVITSEST